jgi:small subunit ribosomal protein S21
VDQALRILKKKLQRKGLFLEMKRRRSFEKPSERGVREKGEAIRRAKKAARKEAQREGLIAMPKTRASMVGARATHTTPTSHCQIPGLAAAFATYQMQGNNNA